MHNNLERAGNKAESACHLWEVILEKIAADDCNPQLAGLLYLACDLNQEIHRTLMAEREERHV